MNIAEGTSKPVLLITGVSGLLGLNLAHQAANDWQVIGTTYVNALSNVGFTTHPVDLTLKDSATDLVETLQPDAVINCAAVANLETSERQPELAWRLNADMPGELSARCAQARIPFIHLSTDAVFDGKKGFYSESDPVNPINAYARTKLAGEENVALVNSRALIARVNFYGWSLSGTRSLCEFFYNHLQEGKPVNGFTDLFYSPMQVNDLADLLLGMLKTALQGVYHVSVNERLSKYEFGCRLADEFGCNKGLINPVSWKDASFRADRSPDLSLCVDRLMQDYSRQLPTVASGLRRLHEEANNGYRTAVQTAGAAI